MLNYHSLYRSIIYSFLIVIITGLCTGIAHGQGNPFALSPVEEEDTAENDEALTNAWCPVLPDERAEVGFSTTYEGHTIYFCCRRCVTKFENNPEAYLVNIPGLTPAGEVDDESHEVDESGDYVESHQSASEKSDFDVLPYLGRFHILTVHFPVALLLVGALFEIFSWIRGSDQIRAMVRWVMALGAVSAIVAVALGLANAIGLSYEGDRGWILWWHRALGIGVGVVSVAAWGLVEVRHRRSGGFWKYGAAIGVIGVAVLVGITAHFGGSLVFGWEYLKP